jgi:RimJ/RimL family protein N-acetyltransferase
MSPILAAPLTLTGKWIRLEPLSLNRLDEIAAAGSDPSIWTYTRNGPMNTPQRMREFIHELLLKQDRGTDLPFVTILRATNCAVGMTRFMDIQPENRAVEIGGTFVTPAHQQTPVNSEAKFLMLRHAFEVWDCLRVQFKTDLRNLTSQRASERLGAVREGVLRDHIILPGGVVRSSVYYSILASEWPQVKSRLLQRLD